MVELSPLNADVIFRQVWLFESYIPSTSSWLPVIVGLTIPSPPPPQKKNMRGEIFKFSEKFRCNHLLDLLTLIDQVYLSFSASLIFVFVISFLFSVMCYHERLSVFEPSCFENDSQIQSERLHDLKMILKIFASSLRWVRSMNLIGIVPVSENLGG